MSSAKPQQTHTAKKPHDPTKGQPDPRLLSSGPRFTSAEEVKRTELARLNAKLGVKEEEDESHAPKRLVHHGWLVINPVKYTSIHGVEKTVKPVQRDGTLTVVTDMSDADLRMALKLGSIEPNLVDEDSIVPAAEEPELAETKDGEDEGGEFGLPNE